MIMHLDMDAFFASVEQLDDPALAAKCVIVGSPSPRGVVAAASYQARRFGIRSAMPMFQARRLCPRAVIVPPRHRRYKEVSRRVMEILWSFSPLVEQVSIDEAYIDVSGSGRMHGDVRHLAASMKATIRQQVGLTCSVGVAPCKFLAKIASDMDKPDGLTIIEPARVDAFIAGLPIARVPGVGPKACSRLEKMGIVTLGQVRGLPERMLVEKLGGFGRRLALLSRGKDENPVTPGRPVKSISQEVTFDRDTDDRQVLQRHLLLQAQEVARRLRARQLRARTVVLKLKTADFKRHTRQRSLSRPTQSANCLYRQAVELLAEFGCLPPVRLVGLGAAGLRPGDRPFQPSLFGHDHAPVSKWEKVEQAGDKVARRFGTGLVKPASLAADPPKGRNPGG